MQAAGRLSTSSKRSPSVSRGAEVASSGPLGPKRPAKPSGRAAFCRRTAESRGRGSRHPHRRLHGLAAVAGVVEAARCACCSCLHAAGALHCSHDNASQRQPRGKTGQGKREPMWGPTCAGGAAGSLALPSSAPPALSPLLRPLLSRPTVSMSSSTMTALHPSRIMHTHAWSRVLPAAVKVMGFDESSAAGEMLCRCRGT